MKEKRKPLWHWFPVIVGVESWTSLLRSECGENGLLGCHDGELKNYKLIFCYIFLYLFLYTHVGHASICLPIHCFLDYGW